MKYELMDVVDTRIISQSKLSDPEYAIMLCLAHNIINRILKEDLIKFFNIKKSPLDGIFDDINWISFKSSIDIP